MSRVRRRLGALIAALLLAGGATLVAAPTAQAEGFPLVTFKIHDYYGNCAQVTAGVLAQQPCSAVSLSQQFTYNPLTHQLIVVGGLTCATATGVNSGLLFSACNASDVNQKWQRDLFDSYYLIEPYTNDIQVLVANGDTGSAYLLYQTTPSFPTGAVFYFTTI